MISSPDAGTAVGIDAGFTGTLDAIGLDSFTGVVISEGAAETDSEPPRFSR